MKGTHFSVGRLSYVIQVGQSNHGFLKAENLSWLWSEREVLTMKGQGDVTRLTEDVGRGSGARDVSSLKSGKGKETPERNAAL